ncbi:pantoate--beta-alanine ligase [Candidatus Pelagibacter sp.]|nr:pantoate--beta-alanine ligase [Candidatus Pelagibacter sp.]
MKILKNIIDLKKAIIKNDNLGFVPTMGGLHKGHISLIKKSKKKCNKTLISIYINPKQFNNLIDFKNYPKSIKKDLNKLRKLKVDYVFLPTTKDINSKSSYKKIIISQNHQVLCAKNRKGHFEGVLEIMDRFLDLIKPKYVFLGEKDFQQLFLIKKYLGKKYNTQIQPCKTIRDKNFIALSTRNFLLSKKELKIVSIIAKKIYYFKKKKIFFKKINILKNDLKKFNIKIDYLEVRNEFNLQTYTKKNKFRIFIAYYINNIRLIDNF